MLPRRGGRRISKISANLCKSVVTTRPFPLNQRFQMLIFPAIDLMSGQVVRLRQGKAAEKTVYSNDPVAFAKRWPEEGGDYLHIVDLDAAFTGVQHNLSWIARMAAAIGIPCQLGGGIRDEAAAQRAFDAGVARVVDRDTGGGVAGFCDATGG